MTRAFYAWLPIRERGLGHGITFSATRLGAAIALPGVAWLVQAIGWRATFVVLGVVGVVWAVGWYLLFRDDPETHPGVSVSELRTIREGRPASAASSPTAAARLTPADVLGSANLWLAMGQYFASNFTFFFCLTWLLPLLSQAYALDAVAAGRYAMAPLLAGVVGNWLGGGLVDAIYRRGRWGASRRLPAILGFVLAAVGMGIGLASTTAVGVVTGLTIAVLGADMTLSPSWAFCSDIGGRNAGAVSGTMNMAGNLGSFVTALAFPYLEAWTGSVVPFFAVGAGLNALAAVAWLGARPERPIGEG